MFVKVFCISVASANIGQLFLVRPSSPVLCLGCCGAFPAGPVIFPWSVFAQLLRAVYGASCGLW